MGNWAAFYAGGEAYYVRLFLICYLSQFLLDYYHGRRYDQELWQPQKFHYQSGIDYDIHDPYTDAFNKILVNNYQSDKAGMGAAHPHGRENLTII